MSRKNKKCTKKQAQRQRRIQDAVLDVLHTPNHHVHKSWEDLENARAARRAANGTSQDQDTVVETKQDQNNVAPKQTQSTTPKPSNENQKTPQTSNQNQDNKQDQNNGDDGVHDQEDNQDNQHQGNPDRLEQDNQDTHWEDKHLQEKQNKQDDFKDSFLATLGSHQENYQDNVVETNNQEKDWGEDRTGDFYINVPATTKQALETALEAIKADFDPNDRIFFTYGATIPEKKTRLVFGKNKNNTQEPKRLAGAAAICKQPATGKSRFSWHRESWTLGYSETTSGAEAELVAISGCLSIAAKELRPAKDSKTASPKVTIITHDQDATDQIGQVLHWDPKVQRYPEASTALVEIVQKAHSLRQSVGAVIELLCINKNAVMLRLHGDSGPIIVRGNQFAEIAARKAITTPDIMIPSRSQMATLCY